MSKTAFSAFFHVMGATTKRMRYITTQPGMRKSVAYVLFFFVICLLGLKNTHSVPWVDFLPKTGKKC